MKLRQALRISALALGLGLGVVASAPVLAQGKPVIFLNNAEPVSLDPMFTQSDAHVIMSSH